MIRYDGLVVVDGVRLCAWAEVSAGIYIFLSTVRRARRYEVNTKKKILEANKYKINVFSFGSHSPTSLVNNNILMDSFICAKSSLVPLVYDSFHRIMNKSSQLTRHSKGSSSMRPEKFTQNDRASEREN